MKRLTIDRDDTLHTEFKTLCSKIVKPMRADMIEMIEKRVRDAKASPSS